MCKDNDDNTDKKLADIELKFNRMGCGVAKLMDRMDRVERDSKKIYYKILDVIMYVALGFIAMKELYKYFF